MYPVFFGLYVTENSINSQLNTASVIFFATVSSYKSMEFEHEEFLPLCNSEIQFMDLELRSHSGKLIEFVRNPQVHIDLKLKDE